MREGPSVSSAFTASATSHQPWAGRPGGSHRGWHPLLAEQEPEHELPSTALLRAVLSFTHHMNQLKKKAVHIEVFPKEPSRTCSHHFLHTQEDIVFPPTTCDKDLSGTFTQSPALLPLAGGAVRISCLGNCGPPPRGHQAHPPAGTIGKDRRPRHQLPWTPSGSRAEGGAGGRTASPGATSGVTVPACGSRPLALG